MKDDEKSKEQLLGELIEMRSRMAELENSQAQKQSKLPGELSRLAEEQLKATLAMPSEMAAEDGGRLIHELQVHQIELELQNQELRNALEQIEESRTKYSDLYDFAPGGYLTIDAKGVIKEANLTLANRVGVERICLIETPFPKYIIEDADRFYLHLNTVFETKERQTCEVGLVSKGGGDLWVLLDSILVLDGHGKELCRTSVIDITDRKNAEATLRQANEELEARVRERTAQLVAAREELRVEIAEHKRTALQLEERLTFETLLADLSARFVNVPADEVDRAIMDAERRICELLGLDVAALWQWSDESSGIFMLTHYYHAQHSPRLPEKIHADEVFPWYQQQVMAGRIVAIASLDELPAEAARDLETGRQLGIKSNLTLPLSVGGGSPIGALGLNTTRSERDWPETVVKGLQLIAQILANALARKRADGALRESEERLNLAADSAGAGLWSLDLGTGRFWTTEKARELFRFSPDEEVALERFLGLVHPDDRELIRRTVQAVEKSKEEGRVEYRIVWPDGSVNWFSSRGRFRCEASGNPGCLMGVSLDITERKRMEEQLKERLQEIEELKQRLEAENIYLQEEIKLLVEHTEIVGQSPAMKRLLTQIEQVSRTDSTVLIQGETGTGKELVARALHCMSSRKDRSLVTVNCASLPPTLIESELFGHEKGAYTGAMSKMVGRFELADGSTLFLDEIGELPEELQAKILRVLENGRFERLGSAKPIQVNVRLLAATNRDLAQLTQAGKFRQDLYYRLNVFPIAIPPLRERPEDIPLLVWSFTREFEKRMGKHIERIRKSSMEALQHYPWPGNVRELRNVIEHAMIVSRGTTLEVAPPTLVVTERSEEARSLEEVERRHILRVLKETRWRVAGNDGAAKILGLNPTTLEARMKKLGIHRPTS